LASTSLDVYWHGTYFIVGHFHLVMVSGTLTAYLGAWHYWFPKLFGRMYPRRPADVAWALVSIGLAVTFLSQLALGNAGMPRRSARYPARFQPLHVVSTVGSGVPAAGLRLTFGYLAWALFRGERAANPWGSRGFEWRTASPPPPHNWDAPLVVDD